MNIKKKYNPIKQLVMNKKLYLPLLLAVLVAFVGCKKMGGLSADYFTVTPSPLEVVGGKVAATITGKFPEKYFKKKVTVTVTPYLVYEGGETAAASYTYQGEKVKGNNQTISYKLGGNITMKASFDYIPQMRKSDLYLAFKVQKGSKSYDLPRVKVAEGVLATAEISNAATVKPALAADKFQRIINESRKADILFLIQQANIRANQLSTDQMKEFHNEVANAASAANKELKGINISSYASPDGGVELNTKLAENREKNTVKYMNEQLKKGNIETDMTAEFTAQDWEGFKELVEKSNIQDKDLILRVLSMYSDPEQREKEIKNMSSTFKVLSDEILPQLRYSRITASIDIIGKSDAEISKLAASDPKSLTLDELLYAGTLTDSKDDKIAIYKKAAEIYPNDYRAYNNVGMAYYQKQNVAEAENWFKKAAKIDPKAPEVQMNLGLISLAKNDYNKAAQEFGNAAGIDELKEATGVLYLKKGEYQKAVKAFGDTKSNNAAIAQILTKDYNKAKNTLSSINNGKDATTLYLLAVVGARTNNEKMVKENLQKAISLDNQMKAFAAADIEFAKYDISSLTK